MSTLDFGEHRNVVVFIVGQLVGFNGEKHASVGFNYQPTLDSSQPFTPYADLTESQVIQWVQDGLGPTKVSELKAKVDALLAETSTATILPLPWDEVQP